MYDIFFQPIKTLLRISEQAQKALGRLKIVNLRDLVFYKPIAYNLIRINPDLTKVKNGELIQTEVRIDDVLRPSSKRSPLKIKVSNPTGTVILVFFSKIHPFIFSKLRIGQKYIITGKVEIFDRSLQISHPEFIFRQNLTTPVMPVYPLTYGIINKQLYGYIREAISILENAINTRKFFSQQQLEEKKYIDELLSEIKNLHLIGYSGTNYDIDRNISLNIKKLAEKELFANQASLVKIKTEEQKRHGRSFPPNHDLHKSILKKLGFELTEGQLKAIKEIETDQFADIQMMRMLQGDVGSGKTLVALLTMLNVVTSGTQTALMAPTDLLSAQHYQFFCNALENTSQILRYIIF